MSAQHAAAVRALARRGEACMRRGRELPRRPAVGRRVHAPPRAPAVHVHPQCCGREAAPNETVSLRARSCQHGAAGLFGATIVGQVASAFCRVSRQQRASPPAGRRTLGLRVTRACPCRRLSSRAALAAHASRAARVRVPATPSTPTSRSAATAGTAAGHCSPRTVRCPLPAAHCQLFAAHRLTCMYRYGRHGRWPGQPTLLPLLLLGVSAYGMAALLILQPTFLDDQVYRTGLEPRTSRPQAGLLLTSASLALDRCAPSGSQATTRTRPRCGSPE